MKKTIKEEVESKEKKLLDLDDNTTLLMNPVKNRAITWSIKGLEALLELKANVYVSGGSRKEKRVYARMNLYLYPKVKAEGFKIQNFWVKDLSETAEDLTLKNFYDQVQPITTSEYEKTIKKWNLMDFIEKAFLFSDKDKNHTLSTVWDLLDKSYAEKNGLSKDKLAEIANSLKKSSSKK
jgi:hypothetical protein